MKKLAPALIVAVAVLGAGYMMGGKGGGAAPPAEAATAAKTKEPEHKPGEVVKLDSITLNLADGRFLKLGLALQLADTADPEHFEAASAKALDEAIAFLGERTYDELIAHGGREKAKQELSKRVAERYEHEVLGVYFTEFVMQ